MSGSLFNVGFDKEKIWCIDANGIKREISWRDIIIVKMRTAEEGPFLPDVFWEFYKEPNRPHIIFPAGSIGEKEITQAIQSNLSGFDDEAFFRAITSTRNREFIVWTIEAYLDGQRSVETIDEIAALPLDAESVFVSELTDVKVDALSRLPRLKILLTSGKPLLVTDTALSILGRMTSLEVLDLEWSANITDQGLRHLYGLTSLRWLDIGFCRLITDQGVSALRSALPSCEIDADGIGVGL